MMNTIEIATQSDHKLENSDHELEVPGEQNAKYLCPQCNAGINWHLDGKYWHGECSGCSLELSGKIHDATQATVLHEEHVCLNIRGC